MIIGDTEETDLPSRFTPGGSGAESSKHQAALKPCRQPRKKRCFRGCGVGKEFRLRNPPNRLLVGL